MNHFAYQNSSQATSWATQRKEAMERAKRLRDDHKYSFARTGEMALDNNFHTQKHPTPNLSHTAALKGLKQTSSPAHLGPSAKINNVRKGLTQTYTSSTDNENTVPKEEALQAANALRLLKSKMRNRSDQPADVLDTIKESEENRRPLVQESSFTKDEAAPKGEKQIEGLREEQRGNYENKGNKNYRKLFKPNVDGTVTTNNKESIYERNPYRTKENVFKLEENQTMTVQEEDYTSFLNIPSRISKTRTMGNNNKENNTEENSYTSIQRTIKAQQNLPKAKREREDQIFQNFEAESPINQYEPPYKKAYQVIQEYNPIDYTIPPSFHKPKEEVLELPQNNRSSKGFQARPKSKRNTGTNPKPISNNDERSLKDSKPDNFNTEGEKPNGVEPLVRCPEGCGRSFFESVVEKHARACKQVFQNKRSAFDIVNHRMTEDQKKMVKLQPSKQNQITGKTMKPKNVIKVMPKWKQQSCAFRAIMKKAKGKQLTNDEQIAIVTNEQENFVQCEYCSRRFNEKAAERHIPFCQSKQKKEALKRYPKGKGIGMKK